MANDGSITNPQRGLYNREYFSSSQASVFIGDILVDEIVAISYSVQQSRRPLFGYADQKFRGVTEGQILVEGSFSINFKEAGYLWLILNHYKETLGKKDKKGNSLLNPFSNTADLKRQNIEQFINGETNTRDRNDLLNSLAANAALTGFSSTTRSTGTAAGLSGNSASLGQAEDIFEEFEDYVWGRVKEKNSAGVAENRRADNSALNPFDIYIAFGDFAGDNRHNHTIQKITDVHILSSSKGTAVDGGPIVETYSFLARDII